MAATSAATTTLPPIQIDSSRWTYSTWSGHPNVTERILVPERRGTIEVVESICAYIWRVFLYILTFAWGCSESFPTRGSHTELNPDTTPGTPGYVPAQREWQRTEEITETFTCRDRSQITPGEIKRILSYLYVPYAPLSSDAEMIRNADIIWANTQQATPMTIVGKRITSNWRETSSVEISYYPGPTPVTLIQQSREVRALDNGVGSYPYHDTFCDIMQPGSAFVLLKDNCCRMRLESVLAWLGYNNYNSDSIGRLLHSCLPTIDFCHTGYWIVSLQENNRVRSVKLILKQPTMGTLSSPADAERQRQALQRKLDAMNEIEPNFTTTLNIQPFVSPGDGQIGYEIRLPQQ